MPVDQRNLSLLALPPESDGRGGKWGIRGRELVERLSGVVEAQARIWNYVRSRGMSIGGAFCFLAVAALSGADDDDNEIKTDARPDLSPMESS